MHTCATLLLGGNVNPEIVAKMLGVQEGRDRLDESIFAGTADSFMPTRNP